MPFKLDERLAQDSYILGDFELSRLVLFNDCQFPWFALVPRRSDKSEIYQLSERDQQRLWLESQILSVVLMDLFLGDKLNIAAIGNLVSQLHLHHVIRFKQDICWPKPIWGQIPMKNYSFVKVQEIQHQLIQKLAGFGFKSNPKLAEKTNN